MIGRAAGRAAAVAVPTAGARASATGPVYPVSEPFNGAEPLLALDRIAVRHRERSILDDITLAVAPGETVALLGPNGAGKTTLLHVAALLQRPDQGTVRIGGEAATPRSERSLRRQIALAPQHPVLFARSVVANAAAGLRFAGVDRRQAERRALAWLDRFGVAHLAGRHARRLSGGEVQRVALARAFALEPALLLLDEPFAGLDAPSRDALLPLLADLLAERRATTLLVTHDLDEALGLAHRLGVLLDGRLVQIGPVAAVRSRPPSRAVARLLGVENLLHGRVIRLAGDRARVVLDPGGSVVEATAGREGFPPGAPVTLAVDAARIEAAAVDAAAERGQNLLAGTVRAVTPGRIGARLVVDVGQPVVAWVRADPVRLFRPGDHVALAIPPEAIHLLPIDA